MAFTNAYLSIISNKFATAGKESSKLPFMVNSTWEGDARTGRVDIISLGNATVKQYVKGTALVMGTGDAAKTTLELNQASYFADVVDKTERITSGYMIAYTEKALANLLMENDRYVLNTVVSGFTTNKITGASNAAIEVNSTNILKYIYQASDKLRAQNALTENAFIAIPSAWYSMVTMASTGKQFPVSTDSYFASGNVPKIAGLNVIDVNAYTITGDVCNLYFGSPDAIANAADIAEVESYKLGGEGFGVATKALLQYGATIVSEKMGGYIKAKRIDEPA